MSKKKGKKRRLPLESVSLKLKVKGWEIQLKKSLRQQGLRSWLISLHQMERTVGVKNES